MLSLTTTTPSRTRSKDKPPSSGGSNGVADTRRRLARDIDIVVHDDHVEVSFYAPCHSIEQLRFHAEGLAITVEAHWDDEADAGPVLFARKHTFALDHEVDFERLRATFEEGVVTLTIPKSR